MRRARFAFFSLLLAGAVACGGDDGGSFDDALTDDVLGGDGWAPTDVFDPDPGTVATLPDDPRTHAGGQGLTVLVYVVADNDLEPFALLDLAEMAAIGSGNGLTFVVQIDRSVDFTSDAVVNLGDFTSTKRLRVDAGVLTELDDLGEVNMGDPATLADFIAWGAGAFPAERTALVLWDHGGAWPGFGWDGSASDDHLTLAEMHEALRQGLSAAGLQQFALIGFDACLMATLEVSLVLRDVGEYLLASEETEPGHGWDYRSFQALKENPGLSVPDLGQALAAGFAAQATEQGTAAGLTLSLVDLYALVPLYNAVSTLAGLLSANLGLLAPSVAEQVGRTLQFGKQQDPAASTHMVDLGQLAVNLGAAHAELGAATDALVKALARAVLVKHAGPAQAGASGLAIYLPLQSGYYAADYDDLDEVAPWRAFLAAYYRAGEGIPDGLRPGFTNANDVAESALTAGGLQLQGSLVAGTGAYVTSAVVDFGVVDADSQSVVLLGELPAQVAGDEVGGTWDLTVLTLSQDGHTAFAYLGLEVEGAYLIATIPFAYTVPGAAEAQLALLYYVLEAATGDVVQATYYAVTDGGYGELYPVAGSTLAPIVPVAGADGGVSWAPTSDQAFDPLREIASDVAPLPEGSYVYASLTVSDFGGHTDTVYATATLGGGCQPACGGAECGADGCGGSCGSCAAGSTCNAGTCEASGQTCDQCAASACPSEQATCNANPACVALATCIFGCADQPCIDACAAASPGGVNDYTTWITCVSAVCADACQ